MSDRVIRAIVTALLTWNVRGIAMVSLVSLLFIQGIAARATDIATVTPVPYEQERVLRAGQSFDALPGSRWVCIGFLDVRVQSKDGVTRSDSRRTKDRHVELGLPSNWTLITIVEPRHSEVTFQVSTENGAKCWKATPDTEREVVAFAEEEVLNAPYDFVCETTCAGSLRYVVFTDEMGFIDTHIPDGPDGTFDPVSTPTQDIENPRAIPTPSD